MRNYRLSRAKKLMNEEGIDVLITWEPWNLRYIAGVYVPMSARWASRDFLVLPKDGEPYVFASTSYSAEGMRQDMPWLSGRVWPAPPGGKTVTNIAGLKPFMDLIGGIMAENGISKGTVALDGCPNYFLYENMISGKGFSVVDGAFTLFRARTIKNSDEVACVRLACYQADAAFDVIKNAIRPGIRENELQARAMEKLYELGADETMDFVVASGPRVNPLHIDYTDRIVRPGDYVVVDINGNSFQGYKSCYYRTFICGTATDEQKEGYEVARKMMYDGMAQMKAGNTTADVLNAWPKGPEFWGYNDRKMLGGLALAHGVGLSLHDYPMFGLGGPSETEKAVKFEEGMTIAIETYFGDRDHDRRGFGTRLEEVIAITADGYELLTKYPVENIIECPL